MASAKKDVCAISDDEAPSTSIQCETETQNEEPIDLSLKNPGTERKRVSTSKSKEVVTPKKQNLDHRRDEETGCSQQRSNVQCQGNIPAHQSPNMANVKVAATFMKGNFGNVNLSRATINVSSKQVSYYQPATRQINNQTTPGKEDKNVNDFLKTSNNATSKKVDHDVRGKRKTLKEVKEHVPTIYMAIKTEGQGIGAPSQQGPVGKDIRKLELRQFHDGCDIKHSFLGGDAGEGKTTTSKRYAKFALALDSHDSCLGDIKLVLYIPMMDIDIDTKTTPFKLLITKQLGGLDDRLKYAGEEWMEKNSDKILIIFDGLDQSNFDLQQRSPKTDYESITSPATIIANILSGHLYPGAKILTTSRWHTFWTLNDEFKPDRIVALRGFSEADKLNLFKQVLPTDADSIIEHIKNNSPYLLYVCSTPNILLNAASVFSKSQDCWPETQTGILGHVVIDLVRSENAPLCRFSKICLKLAKEAYDGMKRHKFQFSLAYLEENGLQRSNLDYFMSTYAILVSDHSKVQEEDMQCYFYHQTIQEFFAALHIYNIGDDVSSYVDDLFEDPIMHNVLLFWSGIIGHQRTFSMVNEHIIKGKDPHGDMREILKKKILSRLNNGSITDIKLCRVLHECDSCFVDGVASSISGVKIPLWSLDPREQFLIFSLVSELGQLEVLDVWLLELNSSNISSCAKSVKSVKHLKASLRLTLGASLSKDHESDIAQVLSKAEFNEIRLDCGEDVVTFSLNCIKGRDIQTISLNGNKNIGYEGFCSLLDFLQYSNIWSLELGDCDLDDGKLKVFADHSEGKRIQVGWIDIDGNHNFGPDGCNHLVDFLGHTRIWKLSMCDCNLSTKKLKAMSDRLKARNFKVERLDLSNNIPSDSEYVDQVTELISSAGSEWVQMEDCQLTVGHVKDLSKALIEKEIILPTLDLSHNTPNPGKEYLPAICQLFHCVSCWIFLHNWQFDHDDLMVLRRELENSRFKERLEVIFGEYGKLKKLSFNGVADF